MTSLRTLAALLVAGLVGCGDESEHDDPNRDPDPQFVFPANGAFGTNVLAPELTTAETGVIYSFRVEGPEDHSFKVDLTLLTQVPDQNAPGIPEGIWLYQNANSATWAVTSFDWSGGTQRFVAIPIDELESGVSDLRMQFTGTGAARFDYFESESAAPTRSKRLDW